jgi:hypothetical protein
MIVLRQQTEAANSCFSRFFKVIYRKILIPEIISFLRLTGYESLMKNTVIFAGNNIILTEIPA